MHDVRFKQMEYTLPEEYQHEQELERQRKIHDSLITRGLQLISDSYLDVMKAACDRAGLPFEYKTFDGKNWECLVDDVAASDYDLVVLGALGMGAVKDSMVGSVTDRVVRRIRVDSLVVRDIHPFRDDASDRIVVAIDGSPQSFAGLRTAIDLARVFEKQVEAVSVYDPYLHYAMFNGIVDVLSAEASKVFRFKEQEQLHEEIIDTGLAKIYESHLRLAQSVARDEGAESVTWTEEAEARMERVPAAFRAITRTAICRYAMERGHSVISSSIIDLAVSEVMPEHAARAMGVEPSRAKAAMNGDESTATWICRRCGRPARVEKPQECPVCTGTSFQPVDKAAVAAAAAREGGTEDEEAFDGFKVKWTAEAKDILNRVPKGYERRRVKARIEKIARVQRLPSITRDFADTNLDEAY